MTEAVNHPDHYGGDTAYETIKVLKAWLSPEEYAGFLRGNVIKYLSRAGKKASASQDYEKAAWYQTELIKFGVPTGAKPHVARPKSEYDKERHGRVMWWVAGSNAAPYCATMPPHEATHWTVVEWPDFTTWKADGYSG